MFSANPVNTSPRLLANRLRIGSNALGSNSPVESGILLSSLHARLIADLLACSLACLCGSATWQPHTPDSPHALWLCQARVKIKDLFSIKVGTAG